MRQKPSLFTAMIIGLSLTMISTSSLAKNDKHDKNKPLPPGLQKKVAKGEPLPPGWQKKLSRGSYLDDNYYNRGKVRVPIDRDGNITIDVDGTFIKLHDKTRKIIDIIND